jgi:GR25 family glycosyltransferase involved in LPS biosynthesis
MNGVYINLSHREDRMRHIETLKQTYPFFRNVKRMNAIKNVRGDIGCSQSHIKALSLQADEDEYFIIMEDDFCILNVENFKLFVTEFNNIKDDQTWDVLTLTPRGDTVKRGKYFNYIQNNQTATCYIVRSRFKDILLTNFKNGYLQLIQNKDKKLYSLDQHWKVLQQNNFIYFNRIFGGQLESYSDIEKRNVNYNGRYIGQVNY